MKKPTTTFSLTNYQAILLRGAIEHISEGEAFKSQDADLERLYQRISPRSGKRFSLTIDTDGAQLLREIIRAVSQSEAWTDEEPELDKLYKRLQAAGSRILGKAGAN